jgi:hypothetical protein
MCVSLGLKKPRDFTVSEGHGYPLVSNNLMLRQTPKGMEGIFIGYQGKKVKKHLVVFMLDKAHGLGFYQNTGHTLSSCIGVPYFGLYPTQQPLLM